LTFDAINKNTLWADAIKKEMVALEAAGVWEYHPPHFKPSREYQFAPLQMIFDIKQEDLRHKARLVAGGHEVESSMWESYSTVVQQRSIRILETIAINEGLSFVTGDISNAFVQAETKKYILSPVQNLVIKRIALLFLKRHYMVYQPAPDNGISNLGIRSEIWDLALRALTLIYG